MQNTLTAFLLFFFFNAQAQKKLTIHGYIQDNESGEKLVGVNIWNPISKIGTNSNNYGYFTLSFPKDTATVVFSIVGYAPYIQFFDANITDSILVIKLEKKSTSNEDVVIIGNKRIPIQERTIMGQINIPVSIVKDLPRFLGEADVLKTIQLLPGVQQTVEGTSGIVVRGGGPDQNLFLLDGLPLYNTQHLFGIFSTFNAEALKNIEFYKGGFPARFGGRLSSVLDVVTKDGDMKKIKGSLATGLIMTRFTLEGPIKKDKTSFFIGGRRSYLDIIAQPFVKKAAREAGIDVGFGAYLYDVNLKVNHIASKKDRFFFSFFSSQDFLKLKIKETFNSSINDSRIRIGYGNIIGSVRWNHVFNKKLFANTILGYTKYRFVTEANISEKDISSSNSFFAKYFSGITDITGNINFDYRPNGQHSIKFGAYLINHNFKPGVSSFKIQNTFDPTIDTTINPTIQNSLEGSLYFEDDFKVTKNLKLNLGVHANFFKSKTKLYPSIQPRLSARYLLPNNWAIKAGYTQMAQSIHLLTNSTTTLPTDLWVPSTDLIKPMQSSQIALGFAKTIWNDQFEFSAEAYYKTMDGVIEYKDGASYLNANSASWDTKVEQGEGWSRGIELLLQKSIGKTKGWLGYTLSKTDRQFNQINFGAKFPYKYDRRHDIEATITHKINKNWEVSGSWGFSTATALSLPIANYASTSLTSPYLQQFGSFNTVGIEYFQGRNGFRLLNYHRLDFGINWIKEKKKYTRTWNLSLYNAYNRKNPFYYFVDYDNITNEGKIKSITLLPIIPNLSWMINF